MSNFDRYKGKLNQDYELIMKAWPLEKKLREFLVGVIAQYVQATKKSLVILELGSGSGESTQFILNALKKQQLLSKIKYLSIDNDPAVVENQKAILKEYSSTLSVYADDAISYLQGMPSNHCDIITASWFLHNFKQRLRKEILEHIFRVLKPKGLFAVMDKYIPDDFQEAEKLFNEQIERFRIFDSAGRPDIRKAMTVHEKEDVSPELVMRLSDSIKIMQNIGFRNNYLAKRFLRDAVFVAEK